VFVDDKFFYIPRSSFSEKTFEKKENILTFVRIIWGRTTYLIKNQFNNFISNYYLVLIRNCTFGQLNVIYVQSFVIWLNKNNCYKVCIIELTLKIINHQSLGFFKQTTVDVLTVYAGECLKVKSIWELR